MSNIQTAYSTLDSKSSGRIVAFYALALGLSWAGWIPYGAAEAGLLRLHLPVEIPFIAQFGPSLAAIILIGLTGGRKQIIQFLVRSCRWKIGFRFYSIALLLPPAIGSFWLLIHTIFGHKVPGLSDLRELIPRYVESMMTQGVYSLDKSIQPSLGPMKFAHQLAASSPIWAGLIFIFFMTVGGPISEEFGWRGYMLPRLQSRYSGLKAAVVLGLLWGGWHTLPGFWYLLLQGNLKGFAIPIAITTGTVPLSILFSWLYNRTDCSILPAMIFHGSFNATLITLSLLWTSRSAVAIGAEMVVGLWIMAGVVVFVSGFDLNNKSLLVKIKSVQEEKT
jgi:hypothetical protein